MPIVEVNIEALLVPTLKEVGGVLEFLAKYIPLRQKGYKKGDPYFIDHRPITIINPAPNQGKMMTEEEWNNLQEMQSQMLESPQQMMQKEDSSSLEDPIAP